MGPEEIITIEDEIRQAIQAGNYAVDTPKDELPEMTQWRKDRFGIENLSDAAQENIKAEQSFDSTSPTLSLRRSDDSFLNLFQEKVSDNPLPSRFIGTHKRNIKGKISDALAFITEKVPFTDKLYYSPEESFDDMLEVGKYNPLSVGGTEEIMDKNTGEAIPNPNIRYIKDEGLRELWKQGGKPFIGLDPNIDMFNMGGDRANFSSPEMYMYNKSGEKRKGLSMLQGLIHKATILPQMNISESGSKDQFVSEMAHAFQYDNPQKWTKFKSPKEITENVKIWRKEYPYAGKDATEEERAKERKMYKTPGSPEYDTHSITEPKLIDWLVENYAYPKGYDPYKDMTFE